MRFVKSSLSTLLVLFFFAAANAQQNSVKSSSPVAKPGASACLAYEPEAVSLRGRLLRKTFVNASKQKEVVWILKLSAPICVKADTEENEFNISRKRVTDVQLVLDADKYRKNTAAPNKQIEASGTLFGAHTQHHFTDVLLIVGDIKPR